MRWNSSRRFVINVYDPSIVEDFKYVLLVSSILAETTRLLQANHQLPTLPGHAYEERLIIKQLPIRTSEPDASLITKNSLLVIARKLPPQR